MPHHAEKMKCNVTIFMILVADIHHMLSVCEVCACGLSWETDTEWVVK